MEEALIVIPLMYSVSGVASVRQVLQELAGVEVVSADAATRRVHVRYMPELTAMRKIRMVLADACYPIANEQPII